MAWFVVWYHCVCCAVCYMFVLLFVGFGCYIYRACSLIKHVCLGFVDIERENHFSLCRLFAFVVRDTSFIVR